MAKMLETVFAKEDRVRKATSKSQLKRLDTETDNRVARFAHASKEAITARIGELEREWDMERFLEMNASTLILSGVALAGAVSRRWLFLPGIVSAFLLQHALQGWCPPLPIFRHFGVRTRQEIERERNALKALRGDFEAFSPARVRAPKQGAQ